MNWQKSHTVVAIASAVGGALLTAGLYLLAIGSTYGRLDEKVGNLGNQIAAIENNAALKGTKIGDLCLKLMDAQNAAYANGESFRATSEAIDKQMEKLGCYDEVPAAYLTNESEANTSSN